MNNCPYCGGFNGYYTSAVERVNSFYEWSGNILETKSENITQGKVKRCVDCDKPLGKYSKNLKESFEHSWDIR